MLSDVNYAEDVNRRKQVALAMDIWTCENARSDTNTGRENSNTARNLQAQHKGTQVLKFTFHKKR